jgi:hypothetical protein
MNPIAAVITPVILTAVFGVSYILVYELVKVLTFGRILGALSLALVGALCLDIAISIIVGNV